MKFNIWSKYARVQDETDKLFEEDVLFRGRVIKSEDDLCLACVGIFAELGHDAFQMIHIPNGGSRHKLEAAKFKKMGVRAGVPDYLMSNSDGVPVAWFEFKFGKNGLQENQKKFQAWTGLPLIVIRTPEEFKKGLKELGL
jgi:hypothetical protein